MVLLRAMCFFQKQCHGSKLSLRDNLFNNNFICLRPRKINTSSHYNNRGKWGSRSQVEGFQPQFENVAVETESLSSRNLIKPFFFTVAFSTASMTGAAIWQYENHSKHEWRWFRHGEWRNKANRTWRDLHPTLQIFLPICLANILVFLAWRAPALEGAMVKYFCSNPAAKNNCWPMVLSTFSHYSLFHIFANMYVLQSFCTAGTMAMGKEQFLGFYMTAGVIASFASYVHKVIANKPGLSLGASGAIMGVLGYTCVTYPDLQLSIILLPLLTFKAGLAIKVIMGLDLAGILMGWRFFDHAAHLGGAAFGVFWGLWGHQKIWQKRDVVHQYWQEQKKRSN